MALKHVLTNNAITRLFARVYSSFDTIPPNIALENYRFYILSNIGYTLGWIIHSIWFVTFLFLNVYVMMQVQLISIACHVAAIIINRQGRHQAALMIGMLEVVIHQLLAVYLLGWDAGFQYITIAITLFPFLKHDGSWLVKSMLALACVTSFLFLEVYLKNHTPLCTLSDAAINVFNHSNIVLCFLFLATWGFCLTITIQLTESLLTERNKELFAAEKAMEQAELVMQLEVKERDMEIYRLRNVELKESNDIIHEERQKSEALLLNILPIETAYELMHEGKAKSRTYDMVTVMFTDIVNFTSIAEKLPAEELVQEIDRYFRAFDEITLRHGVEKIKTIGDAYMCAGGLPVANTTNPTDVINAAIEIIRYVEQDTTNSFKIRVGIHTGPVVAGVVGQHKFQYDIWGDAVNIAARMEQNSEPGRINISSATYELVKTHFQCEYRGEIAAKNKGELEMYFVNGKS